MLYSNSAVLLIISLICFKSSYSIPTFTNEYVHIKLHVPEKTGEELLKNLQEIEHSGLAPVSYHKVIHHYHKRKRPYVKYNFGKNADDELENIVLSEAAHKQHEAQENFEAIKNIDTYVVKHAPKIKESVKTLKIIEEKEKFPYDHQSHHHHTETFKVINAKKPHQYTETYKVVETKSPTSKHNYQHTETFKVLDDTTFKQQHHSFSYPYKFKTETIDTELRPPPHAISRPIETLKIVKEKTPYTHYKQDVESYHRPVIQTDTIEVTKSQTPYQTSQRFNENAVYTNSYGNVQEEQPTYTTSSGYSYEHPSSNYKEEVMLIPKQPIYHSSNFVKNEYPLSIPSSKYQHQSSYHTTDVEPQNHHSYSYNSGNNDEEIRQVDGGYEEENKNYATLNQYDFARDEDLLSEILDATRNKSPVGYEYEPPKFSQNVASGNIDWPKESDDVPSDNHNVAETYRGVDSYSVKHVQGIGSGGYNYHSPFLKK